MTPIQAARADAQSELGKVFEPKAQEYFQEHEVATFSDCGVPRKTAPPSYDGKSGGQHEGVVYIDRAGLIRMVYIVPVDSFATCVRKRLLGTQFLKPPAKIYRLHVSLEKALEQKRARE